MRALRRCWLVCLLAAAGCGKSVSQEELDRARQAVETGLEAWKKGESAAKLKALPEPVAFTDEKWKLGVKLLDFTVKSTEGKPGAPVRCTVTLTVKDRKGKTVEEEAVYEVKAGTPMVVARDPMF